MIQAHAHARKAAQETARTRLAVAGNEHDLAAEQYFKAAEDTSDSEAIRILKLLEEHHHKLAQIVKAKDEHGKKAAVIRPDTVSHDIIEQVAPVTQAEPKANSSIPAPQTVPERNPPQFLKTRSTPSSLAKDIASRRGIPQTQQQRRNVTPATDISPIQAAGRMALAATGKQGAVERLSEEAPPFDKRSIIAASSSHGGVHTDASDADEGFARFYSNLVAGPFSKLSSMLAFAGLPLNETSPEDSPTASRVEKTSARVYNGPDVNQLFSKAALKALEDQQRHPGNAFGPGESFYVIPTSGGTASYANILSRHNQQMSKSGHDKKDDSTEAFVDARETPMDTDAPSSSTRPTLREEELAIENAAIKQILDRLSHRLQAFESHAQDASMAALAQSMAVIAPPVRGSDAMEERLRALEAERDREAAERQKLTQENQRNKQIIAKYRSHWEQLKDSARARERAKKGKEGGGTTATDGN
ncbi:hypothetical protein ANO11243_089600 [Dothideomycetidae sp. 11243]|nr:hypothetical protein ANO11243_089600 [fungal sp. No.11243]